MKVNDRTTEQTIKDFIAYGILDSLGDGISIQDTDFRILYQNSISKNLIGEHTGEYCYEAYKHQDHVCEGCPVALSFKDGGFNKSERSLHDGKTIVEITTSVIRNSAGKIIAGIEVIRDITTRKKEERELQEYRERLEDMVKTHTLELVTSNDQLKKEIEERQCADEALKKSEERYRRITEAITDYTYTVRIEDGKAVETTHCAACFSVTGYTFEEFADDPYLWIRMVAEEDHGLVRQQAEEVLSGSFPDPLEHRITRKDGAVRWVESNLAPMHDVHGNLTSYDGIVRDITEKKKTENMLREIADHVSVKTGEKYFQSLTEFISGELGTEYTFIGELDDAANKIKTVIVYSRGKIIDNMQYDLNNTPCDNVAGKTACIYPRNVQGLFPEDKLLADMNVESYAGVPLFASDGQPLGIIVTMGFSPMEERDRERIISLLQIFSARASSELQRMNADKALLESEEKYRTLFEAAGDAIFIVKSGEKGPYFVDVNEHTLKMFGYTREGIINKTPEDISPPAQPDGRSSREGVREVARAAMEGRPQFFEWIHVRRDGTPFPVAVTLNRVDIGNEPYIQAIVRDISEHKKAEKTLRFLSLVTEQISDSVITTNLNYEITYANHSFQRLYGYSAEEILGKSPYILNAESESEQIQYDIYKAVTSGRIWRGELLNRKKDGSTFHCGLLVFPLQDEKGKIFAYAGIQQDITERKKAEQEKESLNIELKNKNKELEQVVYATSHDLRTPLVNIDGFSKELGTSVNAVLAALQRDDVPNDIKEKAASIVHEDIPEALKYISLSISKMDSLLAGLLKLSRLGRAELRIEKLNINEILSDVASIFMSQIKKTGAKLEIQDLPRCRGDEKQVSQIFSNLLDNAIKCLDPKRPGIIMISGNMENGQSVYCVEDNGIGIDPKYRENIFDIFKQLEPSRSSGEGLGLTIVRKSVERHKGKIWMDSEPGKGSRFFVSLPSA